MQGERTDLPEKTWLDEMIERESIPQVLRTETVEAFCKRFDIVVGTYYYHVSKKENQVRILELTLNIAKRDVPEVMQVLVQKARSGEAKFVEMYLDYILKLAKNLDIKSDGRPIVQLVSAIADKYAIIDDSAKPDSK